jgi:uncharacterized protein
MGKKRSHPTRQSFMSGTTTRLASSNSTTSTKDSSLQRTSASSSTRATATSRRQQIQVTQTTTTTSSFQSPAIVSPESATATQLVDGLLDYTRSLMGHPDDDVDSKKHHIIAYSGGIDSSVVAALVFRSSTEQETVRAVLGLSPAVPSDQVVLAEQVARHIGVPLDQIPTTEGNDNVYIENAGQACLACKTHLYTCLETIVQHSSTTASGATATATTSSVRLYNGTNADDLQDPTRLGLIAAERHHVQSPLRFSTKEQVRLAGRHLGLPNWNYAASPCLRSRLAIGVEAIPQHLQRIEQAERHVRRSLKLDATRNMRVRLLSKNRAMIEVEADVLEEAKGWLTTWRVFFCEAMGFTAVDVRKFKSGSVAPKVGVDTTTTTTTTMEE